MKYILESILEVSNVNQPTQALLATRGQTKWPRRSSLLLPDPRGTHYCLQDVASAVGVSYTPAFQASHTLA